MIELYNMDCMEAMKEMKDNEFDLAIVDPPYGIGIIKDQVEANS
jgi:site-specific DNA-methyltransferase (adenine-specific)